MLKVHSKSTKFLTTVSSLLCLLSMSACALLPAEIEIDKKQKLAPLGKDAKVTVITEKEPSFGYDVICTAEAKIDRYRISSKDFEEEAKEVARKCGTPYVMITRMTSSRFANSSHSTAWMKAIVKTTEKSKAAEMIDNNKDYVKKVATAAQVGNIKNLRSLLEKAQVQKSAENRPPFDTLLINNIIKGVMASGRNCAHQSIEFLVKNYNGKITSIQEQKFSLDDPLDCPSPFIGQSFEDFKNKKKEIFTINKFLTDAVNQSSVSTVHRVAFKHFKSMYPDLIKSVNKSCKQDSTSELCSLKPNLVKLHSVAKKLKN